MRKLGGNLEGNDLGPPGPTQGLLEEESAVKFRALQILRYCKLGIMLGP